MAPFKSFLFRYNQLARSEESVEAKENTPALSEDKDVKTTISARPWKRALPWLPHAILFFIYGVIFVTDPFTHPGTSVNCVDQHWEARFDHTFLEVGDFFNLSSTRKLDKGAEAAWRNIQEQYNSPPREAANLIRINKAFVKSPKAGDPRVLYKVHRLHCLHILWKRWHGQLSEEEKVTVINGEGHDHHCYDILRYALMCEGDIVLKEVGWEGGVIEVQKWCKDPEEDGLEVNLGDERGPVVF